MRDRAAQILKIVCVGLAALLIVQLVKIGMNVNPLAHVTIPDVPSLPADTNAPPAVASKPPVGPGTNGAVALNTNGSILVAGTNVVVQKKVQPGESNTISAAATAASTNSAVVTNATAVSNLVVSLPTNATLVTVANTNPASLITTNTNPNISGPVTEIASLATNTSGTNLAVALSTNAIISGTNGITAKTFAGTNLLRDGTGTNLTNSAIAKARGARSPDAVAATRVGGVAGQKPATLPPEIQARVDRVYESEIFAPIVHPMPMALLGIAGKVAFLRAPNGQTGLVKEGEDLGDMKLLRIGTNRVLVEQDGKKQELMIFSGLGGESLLPKTTDSSNETTKN